ncbi:polyphosphate kinase [Sporobacter termitidis DSM 10068]|uniref:Polyphosphate kinase n=1 Tax=Sporobacter termitidis DSM 10068 TaxID=1123282 RepID=A0A1M5Z9Y0_9FIRM|nr:polyphosphate kinase 1 [Sporobacter termitidis]SHI21034.1 polyphosphate kinase [Sporobacter termitidis DSM 10068]
MSAAELSLDTSFTTNRELSWLKFNDRVLQVSDDSAVPLLERLKFVAIFASNLDEFFMIRVGSLFDLSLVDEGHIDNKSGMTVKEQLREIFKALPPLYRKKDALFKSLESQLIHHGIVRLGMDDLDGDEEKFIGNYFERDIFPVLSPQVVDTHHPFPHIENKALNVAVMLKSKDESRFGIIPVPKMLQRIIFLNSSLTRYILVEDIILKYAEKIFEMYDVEEKCVISVTRNADINPDDETYDFEEDFRHHMKKILKKRARLSAVRLEVSDERATALTSYLSQRLTIHKTQIFHSVSPLELSYVYALEDRLPDAAKKAVTYVPYIPQYPAGFNPDESMMKQAMAKDIMLSYPYESMEPFLHLVKEAAADPTVISIKITLYRLDKKSRLTKYLIDAAENNKDVTVIMELRARFDEQNNIEWAERLEEAGCKVIYGFMGYKVHSKVCLITRHDKGRLQYITQIGTGNYNEKTAKLYADFSLITASDAIGSDANSFFKNMLISNLEGHYNHLLVAPTWLKSTILSLIDGEIEKAGSGRPCGIIIKMNSLTDRDTLDKLSEASCAGVKIQLIIRGICCIVPGIVGKTENITVTSIVGRFLEHARVYCFGSGPGMKMYIASADLMTRNTERRIEVACPVYDKNIKNRLLNILQVQLADNVKSWKLGPDGDYKLSVYDGEQISSQELFMKEAVRAAENASPPSHGSARQRPGRFKALVQHVLPRKDDEDKE